ncbi:MAG: glutaredoxin 3 [Rhizobiaceae bacterium]|jgi:glutaredoxin 3|nr:glutaredoxin 3 [Rhizobiaceae bacterium]
MADVVLYTRKFCGYCSAAKSLLRKKNVNFREFDGTYDNDVRKEMIQKANGASTFPQIFINGEHVGGCDELHALEQAGKLDPMLDG